MEILCISEDPAMVFCSPKFQQDAALVWYCSEDMDDAASQNCTEDQSGQAMY